MIMKRMGLSLLGAVALFVAGWWAARITPSSEGSPLTQKAESPQRYDAPSPNSGEGSLVDRTSVSPRARIPQELVIALQGEAPARTPALLNALEKMSFAEFTPEWAAAIDKILEAGDLEECQYVFSLMEQREEYASVNYLIKQLEHPQEDVRDRALMACEAIAGQVFSSTEQVKSWAKTWEPDPDKQKLFTVQPQEEGTSIIARPGQRPKRADSLPKEMPETK
jgi:hypothetical protein